jgi:hypothetical protein
MTPGTKLADRIEVLGYTVRSVAAQTRISRFDLNDYLNKRRPISAMHLHRLCTFLHCEPEALRE